MMGRNNPSPASRAMSDAFADHPSSRRDFLSRSLAIGASGLALSAATATRADEPRLIVRSRRPLDAETPVAVFEEEITPNRLFFVRSHFGPPAVGLVERWTVSIEGGVARPLALGLEDLARFEQVTIPAVLQCSGNGRSLFTPTVPGVGWAKGAVGNAEWSGVRLAEVLERTGVKPGMSHVHLHGADGPPIPKPGGRMSLRYKVQEKPGGMWGEQKTFYDSGMHNSYPTLIEVAPGDFRAVWDSG